MTKVSVSVFETVAGLYPHLPKSTVTKIIKSAFEEMGNLISSTGEARIYGFGKFEVRTRAARKGRNPQTGETIDLPEKKYVYFRSSTDLARKVEPSTPATPETSADKL
jgi:nucleoid DNA-binding protein